MATQATPRTRRSLAGRYRARSAALSLAIAAPLSDADATIQPMPDASPAKWHLAHTTWFFETFVLRDHVPGYRAVRRALGLSVQLLLRGRGRAPSAAAARHAQPARRSTRSAPGAPHVDEALLGAHRPTCRAGAGRARPQPRAAASGADADGHARHLRREPAAARACGRRAPPRRPRVADADSAGSTARAGVVEIGHDGAGFAFDCEGPRHQVLLQPARARRPAGHQRRMARLHRRRRLCASRALWLSDGWAWVQRENGSRRRSTGAAATDGWQRFGLDGLRPLDPAEPVCHISYYEADAFARWAGARLPTEAEWEAAAAGCDPAGGNQLDARRPGAAAAVAGGRACADVRRRLGMDRRAPILPYPGFRPAEGAVGEYNGKFMCGQMVLRGGSCATPRGHVAGQLPQLLLSPPALAVLRPAPGEGLCDGRRHAPSTDADPGLPRRRARRPRRADPGGAGALALRPPRLGAVRGDHPASRILSDPHRDRACSSATAPRSPRDRRHGRGGGRVRLGLVGQDADPARARSSPPPMCRSTSAASSCANPPPRCAAEFPGPADPSGRGRFHPADRAARPRSRTLPKLGFFPGSTIGNLVAAHRGRPAARDEGDAGRGRAGC